MSSRGKNFRRRTDDDDANGEESTITTTTKPSSKGTITKPKKPSNQAPKLLSFADEEDEESPFRPPSSKQKSSSRPTKSSLSSSSSHRIISTKDRTSTSSSSLLPSNVQPQAGEYTTEKLRELQKNTRTLASSRASSAPRPPEPVLVLKGLIKPISNVDNKGTTRENEGLDQRGGNSSDGRGNSFRKDKDDAENRLASMGIGKDTDPSDSSIPDQATINAIRAKRERLRQSRAAAPDYISLDGGSNHGAAEGLSDEEPEFQGRIALLGQKTDSVKTGVFESVVDGKGIGTDLRKDVDYGFVVDEEDEEEKIWEEEQLRKGVGKRMDDSSNRASSSVPVAINQNLQQGSYVYQGPEYQPAAPNASAGFTIGGSGRVARNVEVISISQQADVASQALKDSVRRLKETHGRTVSLITKNDENLSTSLSNITELEESLSVAGEKFIFMQKLRDFVSVICDLLQHKAPFIEELEEQMQKINEERATSISERRTADNADEMVEVEAAVNAAMSEISKSGTSAAVIAAATAAAQAASSATREQSNLPVKLDEYGRDENRQKRMDMMRRAEARKRRKARSDSKRMLSVDHDSAHHHVEGESSTDESDSETMSYRSNRDLLLQTAEQVFSDAADEYSQLSVVKEKFEYWKKHYLSSYRDAYMSLSAPAIFSPYVRLELLKWDPLHEKSDFQDMKWHSLLFYYGSPEDGSDFSPDDADANLVPGLVEKVAIPILRHEIVHCWDMLSSRGTKNAVSATNLVIDYVPASCEALRELLSAIHSRLADAVANLIVPTWSTIVTKTVPNAARIAAYRFGMSVRLLKNICLWNDIIAFPILEQLALDELLSGKVLPHLRGITPNIHDAITRTERVISSISGVWSGSSVTGERSHKLQPLVDYVITLGRTLEKKHASGMSESETGGLARRLKKMLVELNDYDKARAISRTFQLKEAL